MRLSFITSLLGGIVGAVDVGEGHFFAGFDFRPSYGTSAVAYANGTLLDVAIVYGGDEYKKTMQRLSKGSSTYKAYVNIQVHDRSMVNLTQTAVRVPRARRHVRQTATNVAQL